MQTTTTDWVRIFCESMNLVGMYPSKSCHNQTNVLLSKWGFIYIDAYKMIQYV